MYSKQCKLHLKDVNMTRYEHLKHALNISWRLLKASIAVFIHAFAPRWFKKYASGVCNKIVEENMYK